VIYSARASPTNVKDHYYNFLGSDDKYYP
jgi:hypothetical protein